MELNMNREQIEKYIEEYGRDIYSFCTYLTRNREDADDLYQQTILVTMQKNEIDDNNNPKSYLISIAANLWNNHKRKYLWRKKKADIVYLQSEDMECIADEGKSVYETFEKKDELENVLRLVDKLPEKMKIVILMHYMEDMSLDEISKALKIPTGTVKSRIFQAKAKLRERMNINHEG
jgi:RNA polymerase sigma-70 factor (ECF subfamily)